MLPFDTLLFDLDGTLTDSKDGIIHSFRFALEKMGVPCAEPAELGFLVGPPLLHSMTGHFGMDEASAQRAVEIYREYFSEIGMYENKVYAGVPEMLGRLKGSGKRLILATSKLTLFTERILKHFELDQYFSLVVGSNHDGTRATKGEVIAAALAQLEPGAAARSVMIGDREHDIIGARQNGLRCIAVTYGYGSQEELEAAGAEWIVGSVGELEALIAGD